MVTTSTSHSEAFQPSVTDDEYAQLLKLSTLNPIKQDDLQTPVDGTLFQARTYAHRARLSQLFTWFHKFSRSRVSFPELKQILEQREGALEVFLAHDAGKNDPIIQKSIDALALLQGFNFRNPPRNMPENAVTIYKKVLRHAIDDINHRDQ